VLPIPLLQVTSLLHRQKIMRAMQRQMLGLGSEPGSIKQLTCSSSSNSSIAGAQVPAASSSIVQCIWRPPQLPGEPPLHKYVLERFALAPPSPAAAWQPVVELDDLVVTRFSDAVAAPGSYQYRVAAWNLYGRSPYAFSDEVAVVAQLGDSHVVVEQQAAAAGVPAEAVMQQQKNSQQQLAQKHQQLQQRESTNSIAAEVHAAAMPTFSESVTAVPGQLVGQERLEQQQRQEQQLLLRPPAHLALATGDHSQQQRLQQAVSSAGNLQHQDVAYDVVPTTQQQQQQQQYHHQQQQHQGAAGSLPDGLVRHMGSCSSGSAACHGGNSNLCTPGDDSAAAAFSGNGPAAGAAAGACSGNSLMMASTCSASDAASTAAAAAAAAGAQSHMPHGSNVVWVVGDSALAGNPPGSSPAAIVAQAQLLAGMHAAAGAAAGVGSQQGQVGGSSRRSPAGTASKAAAAGSWSVAAFIASHIGRWLRALLNSLLLLVVPICVRLLPVPVLHQLARGLAQLLRLLPEPLRRVLQPLGAASSGEAEQGQQANAVGVELSSSSSGNGSSSSGRTRTSSSTGAAAADAAGVTAVPAGALAASAMGLPLHLSAEQVGEQLPNLAVTAVTAADAGLSGSASSAAEAAAAAAALKQSRSQLNLLLRGCASSPGSSAVALPAAASPVPSSNGAAGAAGPYAGMYGFAWQGPAAAMPAAAAAMPAQQADMQAMFSAFAADSESQQQQQQQQEGMQIPHVTSQGQLAAAAGVSCNDGQCYYGSPEQQLLLSAGLPNKKRCAHPG
jgi:hypothetical protein